MPDGKKSGNKINIETEKSSKLISLKKEKPDLRKKEQPLVDIKVTNPVTYIKSWWKKVIGNEGVDIRIKMRPLTAIAATIIIVTVVFGIGHFVLPFDVPFFEYTIKDTTAIIPLPTTVKAVPRDTAFTGELRYSRIRNRYYLISNQSEAINLDVPENIDLSEYIGRRILATGLYDQDKRLLKVETTTDLEVLPTVAENVPTTIPSSIPSPKPSSTPTMEPL